MVDLVATVPKAQWQQWLAEGGLAGDPEAHLSPYYYQWQTNSPLARNIRSGDRLYLVAGLRLRGYSVVLDVNSDGPLKYNIVRGPEAVACTIRGYTLGFQGLRYPWWAREELIPFPGWQTL